MTEKLDDPQFWHWRAEEARTIADNMKAGEPIMERIAEDYERIAKITEQVFGDRK